MEIVNTLIPILVILGLGALLARWRFLGEDILKELNRLIYFIGLPALIVHSLAKAPFEPEAAIGTFVALFTATIACLLLGILVAWLLRMPGRNYGTFLQAAFRGNLAYIGIPVIAYVFSDQPESTQATVMATALLVLAPNMVVYNVLSVGALLASHHRLGWEGIRRIVIQIATNPLIIASLTGTLISLLPWELPLAMTRSLETIGQMAIPIALLCIGGSLATVNLSGQWLPATAAALLKVAFLPVIALVLGRWMALNPIPFKILMVFAACPTAAASYIMAIQMNGDEALASSSIVLSTLLSAIPLSLVVGIL